MTQQTIDRLQPLVDEYCKAKIKRKELYKVGIYNYNEPAYAEVLGLTKIIKQLSENILQILFDDNKETVQH